jgi:hypothetical protein
MTANRRATHPEATTVPRTLLPLVAAALALAVPSPAGAYGGAHAAPARPSAQAAAPRTSDRPKADGPAGSRPGMPGFMSVQGQQGIHGSVAIMSNPSAAYRAAGSHGTIGLDPRAAAAAGAFR